LNAKQEAFYRIQEKCTGVLWSVALIVFIWQWIPTSYVQSGTKKLTRRNEEQRSNAREKMEAEAGKDQNTLRANIPLSSGRSRYVRDTTFRATTAAHHVSSSMGRTLPDGKNGLKGALDWIRDSIRDMP
jgi:hypothetical protein